MKEKIKELFKEYYNDKTMPVVELEDKVLALFDVVEQSEQLEAFNEVFQIAWELVREESDYIRLLKIKESL